MTIDLRAALRRIKPERFDRQLTPRSSASLVPASGIPVSGRPAFVPDTNVYIKEAAGTLPPDVSLMIERGLLFHCSVCLGELSTGIANADPAGAKWGEARTHYAELFDAIPDSRLLVPGEDVWIEAGLIAGTLSRTQNFQRHQRKECLNDALIYLTAAKAGLPVLTANREDFDLIQQLAGRGEFIWF